MADFITFLVSSVYGCVDAQRKPLHLLMLENMLSMILVAHAGMNDLTPRECDIMHHVSRGNSNRETAHALGIGEETVKTYMRTILAKLHANDRAHAVAICMRRGYLDLSDLP